jgi:hypothetical protein
MQHTPRAFARGVFVVCRIKKLLRESRSHLFSDRVVADQQARLYWLRLVRIRSVGMLSNPASSTRERCHELWRRCKTSAAKIRVFGAEWRAGGSRSSSSKPHPAHPRTRELNSSAIPSACQPNNLLRLYGCGAYN